MDMIQSINQRAEIAQGEAINSIKNIVISCTTDQGNEVELRLDGIHDDCTFSSVLSSDQYWMGPIRRCLSFKLEGSYEEMSIIVHGLQDDSIDENELMKLLENGV